MGVHWFCPETGRTPKFEISHKLVQNIIAKLMVRVMAILCKTRDIVRLHGVATAQPEHLVEAINYVADVLSSREMPQSEVDKGGMLIAYRMYKRGLLEYKFNLKEQARIREAAAVSEK